MKHFMDVLIALAIVALVLAAFVFPAAARGAEVPAFFREPATQFTALGVSTPPTPR